ncbi:MAG: tRNA epoxyqueuosine(34) reductase QueG [Anaerolineales bacterium]|nr:tRNA epoxyqueuosine(34) reductase QueG [Anaerolineales bacterium]
MAVSLLAFKAQAVEAGFNLAGVSLARPAPHLLAYQRWVAAGMHGEMAYLARPDRLARRQDLNQILPGVQSLAIVALDYHTGPAPAEAADPARGRIAAYAWGQDYHAVMAPRLEALAEWVRAASRAPARHRVYVDTGAILERGHAQQAGLGFIGKNTLLIHPRRGSWFFLGEILTTADFDEYDAPSPPTLCGTCARCLAACPTAAFPAPYVLDARRCISYLTIEHKGWIPLELRPALGNWVFGCDVCQAVCPWQRFAVHSLEPAFSLPDPERAAPPLAGLLRLDPAGFQARFGGSPLARLGRDRLVRNACVAAGNCPPDSPERPALQAALEACLTDASPLVRAHAAWALTRLGAPAALAGRLPAEADPHVHAELVRLLAEVSRSN